jgi:hypothetical protein
MKRTLLILTVLFGIAIFAAPFATREASAHVGEHGVVCGTVEGGYYGRNIRGHPTFLNLDAPYPQQPFRVVIWGEHRHLFGQPEKRLQGQKICVSGKIGEYRGVPQIVLRSPGQLEVVR